MPKPPKSGPHSDIDGVNAPMREGIPNRNPDKGTAKDIEEAERDSAGRPPNAGKLSPDKAER